MRSLRQSLRVAFLVLLVVFPGRIPRACAQPLFERIARAQPDEFFAGIGAGYFPLGEQPAGLPGQPKVNQSYLWGMATDGRYVWIGTAVDTVPYALAATAGISRPEIFTSPQKGIPYRVSEYWKSQYPGLSFAEKLINGDWRPPRVYRYDTQTGELRNFTPDDPLINATFGLRSAGIHRGMALLAGPTLSSNGICLFAFEVETGRYLGSALLSQYNDIRRWQVANGDLYTAVRNAYSIRSEGTVLKWIGNRATPFLFETVGLLDNEGAYLAVHEGRLVCGTWPSLSVWSTLTGELPAVSGLWVSPVIPARGLSALHARRWTKVWSADAYDPDPVIAATYAMGAMASYGDHLYFGTMMFPGLGAFELRNQYGTELSTEDEAKAQRSAIVVRAKNLARRSGPEVELLYGEPALWVYSASGGTGSWSQQPTGLGRSLFGPSGLGDPNNLFLWSAAVHENRLYLGTMDLGNVTLNFGELVDGVPKPTIGADLFRIGSANAPATLLSRTGCDNQANHGIINLVSTPSGLYLGTANGMNLLTDPNDGLPVGGWEMIRVIDPP